MNDKTKLIDSMANLIQHVSMSQKNQEQIFATLSVGDVKKILSNLEDSNEKLRKTTLMLLSQLLYQNPSLQRRFCELTNTPQFPGKIVFSQKFPKNILYQTQSLKEVVKILKDNSNIKQRGLFWYIDGQTKPKILQIAKRNSFTIDPLNCVVGVWVQQQQKQQPYRISLPINSLNTSYNQPQIINNSKTRLNKSYNFEKSNNVTQYKPQTPMKISLVDVGATENGRYRVNSYLQQTSPIQIKSQIKSSFKQEPARLISATERKNYQQITSTNNYDTVKYIKPNLYVSTTAQGTVTPQSYQQPLAKNTQTNFANNATNRINGEFKSYVFPRQEFRKT